MVLAEEKAGAIVLWLVSLKKNGIWEDFLEDELSDMGYQCVLRVYLVWSLPQAANPSRDWKALFVPSLAGCRACGCCLYCSRGAGPWRGRCATPTVQCQPWLQVLLLRDQLPGSQLVLPKSLQIHAGEIIFLSARWVTPCVMWGGQVSAHTVLSIWHLSDLSSFRSLCKQTFLLWHAVITSARSW